MNWYKISQQYYSDIGHSFKHDDQKVIIWTCDPVGNNFQMDDAFDDDDNHNNSFGDIPMDHFWGRWDYYKDKVSIAVAGRTTTENDIPNRLIKRLISEFPGASIWAFTTYGATQIL